MPAGRLLVIGFCSWLLTVGPARAHFLFIGIGPPAEGGRRAEVYFSDRAEAGDPRFVDKIAATRLWAQASPGVFQPLAVRKGDDRLRAVVPPSGSLAVIGSCTYGVLPRGIPFLLRHYPKALAGDPEQLDRLRPFGEVPLEILATLRDGRLRLVALRDGKPVPHAEFHTVGGDLSGETLTAGPDGGATWTPPRPGQYAVYTSQVTRKAGKWEGTAYQEVRDFATLAFRWPLGRRGADPGAVALFQEAIKARAHWQRFPGFRADIAGRAGGRPFRGRVTVDARGAVSVHVNDRTARPWVAGQLESIVLHRGAGRTAPAGPAKQLLRYADEEAEHPLGRLLLVEGGRFASSYRVRDGQILAVNRHVGKEVLTILVLENERNGDGLYLPRAYVVEYWDAGTGELRRTETVRERWQRVGRWDLPAAHTQTSSSAAGLEVRGFTLSGHQLLKAE
jgi:hypothetical protein